MNLTETHPRELAFRKQDGLQVTLLWWEADNSLAVSVVDQPGADAFLVPVDGGQKPLDVFRHPFAHAARRGII